MWTALLRGSETWISRYRTEENASLSDSRTNSMLKNLFAIGLIAVIGLVALKVVFGLLGPLVGLLLWLAGLALKLALVGAVVYGVVRIVSPDTARRITSGFRR